MRCCVKRFRRGGAGTAGRIAGAGVRNQFVFNKYTLGESSAGEKLGISEAQLAIRRSTCSAPGLHPGRCPAAANDYCCGDDRGSARISSWNIYPSSIAPTVAADRSALHRRRRAYPHDGGGPAFISGAISKTINMPADATLEDVKAAYLFAWKSMVRP